jgi:hypothetical protein
MRWTLALAALLATLAGCMCGPQVGSVEASADVPAVFDAGNKTAVTKALEGAGFTVDEAMYGTVHGVQGDQDVAVFASNGSATEVQVRFDVPDREFSDSEGGSAAANRYIAEESARRQPAANATFELVLAAMGLPAQSAPAVGGFYAIC